MIASLVGLFGPQGIVLVVAVFLLFFGGKKLPKLAKVLQWRELRNSFRSGLKTGEDRQAVKGREHES